MKKSISILAILIFAVSLFAENEPQIKNKNKTAIVLTTSFGVNYTSMWKQNTDLIVNKHVKNALYNTITAWIPPFIEIGIGIEQPNGFIFSWNNSFGTMGRFQFSTIARKNAFIQATNGSLQTIPTHIQDTKNKGFIYGTQFLFGYTVIKNPNFRLNLYSGIALELSLFNMNLKELHNFISKKNIGNISGGRSIISIGVPLQLEVHYYFSPQFGILTSTTVIPSYREFGIIDSVGLSYTTSEKSYNPPVGIITKGYSTSVSFKIGLVFKF